VMKASPLIAWWKPQHSASRASANEPNTS
jgi:hypothetical protein